MDTTKRVNALTSQAKDWVNNNASTSEKDSIVRTLPPSSPDYRAISSDFSKLNYEIDALVL